MNSSIVVQDVGKAYRIGQSRRERFKEWFIPFYTSKVPHHWVLHNISFAVRQGESVGIVGMNGAGKSTLLKIIAGTTTPTTGHVAFNGRVSALLELGMGFHSDLSGRRNIALAGQLMGFSPRELEEQLPAIEDFAEIGAAIEEPVRTYSSGMQMRLAFALASAIRPDILIVDEALSVGDAYFQQKCFTKIRQFRDQGTSLLFVSHDKGAVLQLCDRAILLNKGRTLIDGSPQEVMDLYNAILAEREAAQSTIVRENQGSAVRVISGNKKIELSDARLVGEESTPLECVAVGQKVAFTINYQAHEAVDDVSFGILIKERTGMEIFGINTAIMKRTIAVNKGDRGTVAFHFPAEFGPGMYSITVAVHKGENHVAENYHWIDLASTFTVINTSETFFTGVMRLDCTAVIQKEIQP